MSVKNSPDVSFVLTAQDQTQGPFGTVDRGLKGLGNSAEQLQQRMALSVEKMRQQWMGTAAGFYAAAKTAQQAWDMAGTAADYQERIASIGALGAQYNMTGNQIVKSMQDASRGLLSMQEAADMASKALNLSLSPKQMVEFTKVSEQLTDVIGGTIPEAFDRMTLAAASGRTTTLAQMGIIVDLDAAYKRHGENLSEVQKQQIRLNTILEAAKQRTAALGEPVDTTRDKMDRLARTVKDLQLEIGQGLIRGGYGAVGALQYLAAGTLGLTMNVFGLISAYRSYRAMVYEITGFEEDAARNRAAADEAMLSSKAALEARNDLMKQSADNFGLMASNAEAAGNVLQQSVAPALKVVTDLTDKQKAAILKSIYEQVKAIEEWEQEFGKAITDEGERLNKHYQAWNDHVKWMAENQYNNWRKSQEQIVAGQEAMAQRIIEINRRIEDEERKQLDAKKQSLERFWAEAVRMANSSGEYSAGIGMMMGSVKEISEIGGEKDPYQAEVMRAAEHYEEMLAMANQFGADQADVFGAWEDYQIAKERATQMQRLTLAKGTFGALAGFAQAFYVASGKQNELAFRAYQAFSIAQAMIDTYLGAANAMASVPYPYNFIAAATVVAAGLAMVATIASQSPGASTTSAATIPGASSGGYTYTSPTTPSWQEEKKTSREPMGVTIQIYGDVLNSHDDLARRLVEPIRKAINDGER